MGAYKHGGKLLVECQVHSPYGFLERARAILDHWQSHTRDLQIKDKTQYHSIEMVKDLLPDKHPDLKYLSKNFSNNNLNPARAI